MASNFKTSGTDIDSLFLPREYTVDLNTVPGGVYTANYGTVLADHNFIRVNDDYDWKSVAVGGTQGPWFGIKTNGTLWAWGANDDGTLGLGNVVFQSSPVQVGSLNNWSSIACRSNHAAGVKTDGTLWTWGYNAYGQLGLGDITHRSSPTQVGSLTNWKTVYCSQGNPTAYTFATKTDGTLWAWGRNSWSMLGLGDSTSRSSPTQVGSLTNWKQISCSSYHAVAVKTDGTLWAWGTNTYGQVGQNNVSTYNSPVQVGSLNTWSSVSAGGDSSCAIKNDYTAWSWGYSLYGKLGFGGGHRSSPVQVGALTEWKQFEMGDLHSLLLKRDGTLWRNGALDTSGSQNTALGQVGTSNSYKQISVGYNSNIAIRVG